jgi:hypothetical protein
MLRQGGSDAEIAHGWNSNWAFRSATAQIALGEAARARLARRGAAAKRDRSAPPVQRPGSPLHFVPESDVYLKRLEKPGQPLSAKEAAAFVTARRNSARR